MDPLSTIGNVLDKGFGLIDRAIAPRNAVNARGERIAANLSRPQDNTQLYILGGVGLLVVVLVFVVVLKKR